MSKHLRVLREVGLVEVRGDGRHVALRDDGMQESMDHLEQVAVSLR